MPYALAPRLRAISASTDMNAACASTPPTASEPALAISRRRALRPARARCMVSPRYGRAADIAARRGAARWGRASGSGTRSGSGHRPLAATIDVDPGPDLRDDERPQSHGRFRVVAAVLEVPPDAVDL